MDDPRRQQSCQAVKVSDAPWRALPPRGARATAGHPPNSLKSRTVSPATLYRYILAARTANTPSVAEFN